MKRFIILTICMLAVIVAMAKPPHLNVEKLFDGSYNSNKSVSIHISKSKDKYFRGFTVNGNADLVEKVTALFRKDAEQAEQYQDIIDSGRLSYSSMTLINNNLEINIGISYDPGNSCYLFISGPAEAFK